MNAASPAATGLPAPTNRRLRWLTYLLALVFLLWVVHDIHPGTALSDLRGIRWGWIALGIALDLLSYAVQGERWRQLLASFAKVRLPQTVRAIYAGLFANQILPLRSGELVRAFIISRDTRIGLTHVLTTVGLERLMDGVVLATALGVVSLYMKLPGGFARAADIFGIAILTLALSFIAGVIYLNRVPVLPEGAHPLRRRVRQKLAPFLEGLRTLGNSAGFYGAMAVSPIVPALQFLALWAMGRGYGLGLGFWPMAAVLLMINFGVALPNAPANVGAYQFFCALGLTLFGVEKSRAAGFSIAAHFFMTVPFLLVGFSALVRSGLSVAAMRERVSNLVSSPAPPPGE